ncbi:MAG: crossover junction endodeoxyribonuclease RuvC [Acidobacteria bacterium]|nr:crossover junction endodeoxyribonuclease RuvC [Acidobacteriota bacterium]
MTALLAIDPGLRTTGWALFEEIGGHSLLMQTGISRSSAKTLDEVARAHDENIPRLTSIDRVVVEQMQVYSIQKSKGDPADLVNLSLLGGYLAKGRGARSTYVDPGSWKGQRPKDAIEPLVKKYLTEAEVMRMDSYLAPIKAKSLLHNAYDAVGIGLWALGRWPR